MNSVNTLLLPGTTYTLDGIQHTLASTEQIIGIPYRLTTSQIKKLAILKDLLYQFSSIAHAHKIPYYISCATLLGQVKLTGFLPWDSDVDVCVPLSYAQTIYQALRSSLSSNYKVVPFEFGFKLSQRTLLSYPFLDVMIVSQDREGMISFCYPLDKQAQPTFKPRTFFPRKRYKVDDIYPLRLVKFEGLDVYAPARPKEVCVQAYGEHCLERSFAQKRPFRWMSRLLGF